MIVSPAFSGKRYAVLGLARSGLATVEALLASGARVTAWDGKDEARAKLAAQEGLDLADPLDIDLVGYDGVVVSPGVPLNRHPIAAKARDAGVPVIGDIELFAQARASLPPHKVVGITGTNGKSTTTALIHHILQTAGVPSLMGGNIGLPILSQDPLPEGGVYVLELSSYQIDLTFSLDCDVAVLTNITPDHLDRYDGFEGYAASKARLFGMRGAGHVAVIATEDDQTRAIATQLRHPGAGRDPVDGAELDPGLRRGDVVEVGSADIVDQSRWPALQGPHNAQNAACAIATCTALGLGDDAIEAGLASYPGLPHRMERVAEKGGVLYVNDSKATNATATAPALAAYPAIHWILGGLRKTDELDDCAPFYGHVRAGYVIGEAAPLFAHILGEAGLPVTESGTLDQAVRDAAATARPGETVMLSPACASFDQFTDYEARGEAFRAAVGAL
ncbi:UDP-N-acetylmuramoyl-L-alanine--D-glutamate ligase [Sphingomonas nostoxanthinifaciens]|uniref:UDP-N-acetylmuramoyl-L-alanine--D-glutamate ligase n=1 Tax=Sphingomonas nostoxanthinifaciens TaxID=2872652 RepID=UPI001CC1F961|nr:UDP-N-acetylmuramoyl-L-alanine--D-glutamate ligase [Sphingomonas nostoxanthinifaciens]UAK24940.1 UDP-N-acetylmuramoyl-L-alanine--D-glutamate ligase [Sphingomonas nostoxanthinifaciens]